MIATPAFMRLAQMDVEGSRRPAIQAPLVTSQSAPRDIKAELAASYESGVRAGRVEAEVEGRLRQDLIEAMHKEETRQLLDTQLAEVANGFRAGLIDVRNALADSIAQMLKPMFVRLAKTNILDALTIELRTAIDKASVVTVVVQGPELLIEPLQTAFQDCGGKVRFEVTDAVEVRLSIDQSLVETRIGDWMKLIEAAS